MKKLVKLFTLFLMFVFHTSCGQNQTNSPQVVQAKNNTQALESKIDATRLKYTTGVRSILEDSKGNSWFGSYNEGVCLLHDGECQYFTTENGLSHNQVRTLL